MKAISQEVYNEFFEGDNVWTDSHFRGYLAATNSFFDASLNLSDRLKFLRNAIISLGFVKADKLSLKQAELLRDAVNMLAKQLNELKPDMNEESYQKSDELLSAFSNQYTLRIQILDEFVPQNSSETIKFGRKLEKELKDQQARDFVRNAALGGLVGAVLGGIFGTVYLAKEVTVASVGLWSSVGAGTFASVVHICDRLDDYFKNNGEDWKQYRSENTYQAMALSFIVGGTFGYVCSVAAGTATVAAALEHLGELANIFNYPVDMEKVRALLTFCSQNRDIVTGISGAANVLHAYDQLKQAWDLLNNAITRTSNLLEEYKLSPPDSVKSFSPKKCVII